MGKVFGKIPEKSADWAQKCLLAEDSTLTKMIPPDNVRMTALRDVWRYFRFFEVEWRN